jgi:hypothetical protein
LFTTFICLDCQLTSCCKHLVIISLCSSVSNATDCRLDHLLQFTAEGGRCHRCDLIGCGTHPSPTQSVWGGDSFSWVNRLECEAHSFPSSNGKLMNQWSLPPLLHMSSCRGDSDPLSFVVADKVKIKLTVLENFKPFF